MHPKLKAALHKKMIEFIDENCEEDEWSEEENVWYPPRMEYLLTNAAEVVFDAITQTSSFTAEQVLG